ncbi:UMP kinase [Candidatus Woesearchaeota archaeon]|nr:UMP kinase [Candidatus Woesearchaeota archaeon]
MKTVIISLGGSLIVPDEIDTGFLKRFRQIILDFVSRGNRAVIVAGGGMVCRRYQKVAEEISGASDLDKDWIGIRTTKLNAELIRVIFGDKAHKNVIDDPTEPVVTPKKIIVGSGWRPGCSSDKDAVLLADNFKANNVINMTNIDHVYDKDPGSHDDAEPLKALSWKQLLGITGDKWVPGMNVPFDPEAAKLAQRYELKVFILDGRNLDSFKDALEGRDFEGTLIS